MFAPQKSLYVYSTSVLVTTSKALVTISDALVPSSLLFVLASLLHVFAEDLLILGGSGCAPKPGCLPAGSSYMVSGLQILTNPHLKLL